MALTFYYGSGSPYAWRVWLALEHKGIPYDFKLLSFSEGDTRKPDFTAVNPRQKVPAIVDDGFALYESVAIMEYLEERWPDRPRLYSAALRERAVQRRLALEADDYLSEAMDKVIQAILSPQDDAQKMGEHVAALKSELARWEAALTGDYLAGAVSAADFTLYPRMALIPRFAKRKPGAVPADLIGPRLAAWMQRMEQLAIVQKTLPPHWK